MPNSTGRVKPNFTFNTFNTSNIPGNTSPHHLFLLTCFEIPHLLDIPTPWCWSGVYMEWERTMLDRKTSPSHSQAPATWSSCTIVLQSRPTVSGPPWRASRNRVELETSLRVGDDECSYTSFDVWYSKHQWALDNLSISLDAHLDDTSSRTFGGEDFWWHFVH